MKKISLLLVLFAAFLVRANAQTEMDGLLFSQNGLAGTARFVAGGGAFASLGSDFTTTSWNPAGIGLYKNFDLSFSSALGFNNTQATYNGYESKDNRVMFNIPNFGMIFAGKLSVPKEKYNNAFKYIQFGFGINRLNDYNNRAYMQGPNVSSNGTTSLTDAYATLANDGIWNGEMQMAYNCYLIDTLPGSDGERYFSYLSGKNLKQRQNIATRGSQNEMVFTMGANYGEKLYLGATVGFPMINYEYESTYSELDETSGQNFSVRQTKDIEGTGVNLKLGAIYRPVDCVRLGLAFHTPSYYFNMKHFEELDITGDIIQYASEGITLFDGDYQMVTPLKVIAGLSTIIAKQGFISVEYEYQDPSLTHFWINSDIDYQNGLNDEIELKYAPTHNFRVGGEFTTGNYAFRLGYGYYGSPYAKNEDGVKINTGRRETFSGGIGYKNQDFYIDFAYGYTVSQGDYYFYNPSITPVNPAYTTLNKHNFVVTVGCRVW